MTIGESKRDIVAEAVVLQQKLGLGTQRRPIDEIRVAESQDVVGTFGQNRVKESRPLDRAGQFVVVDQLGIAEHPRPLAEQPLDGVDVQADLLDEFGPGIEETETVIIGLASSTPSGPARRSADPRAVFLKLFEKNPVTPKPRENAPGAAGSVSATTDWSADSTCWRPCDKWRRS
jgi:hypothetical protein